MKFFFKPCIAVQVSFYLLCVVLAAVVIWCFLACSTVLMCQKNLIQFQYWDNAIYVFDLNWFSEADYTKNVLRLANNMLPVLSEEVIVDQSFCWKHDWNVTLNFCSLWCDLGDVEDTQIWWMFCFYFNTCDFFSGFFASAVCVLYSDLTSKLKSSQWNIKELCFSNAILKKL